MPQMFMRHEKDPKEVIFDKIGKDTINDFRLIYNQVLVGIYVRPNKTLSGIEIPDQTVDEDRYQGKAGLVLKVGPTAFQDDGAVKFYGQKVEVGDWVVFRPSSGLKMTLNKTDCISLRDVHIEGVISNPDVIF